MALLVTSGSARTVGGPGRASPRAESPTRSKLRRRIEPLTKLGTWPCSAGHTGQSWTVHSCGEAHHGSVVLVHRRQARPIRLAAAAGAGDREGRPGVVVFGCVTPTNCRGTWDAQYSFGSCPPPSPIWAVLNLDPFGRPTFPLGRYREREPRAVTVAPAQTLPPRWPLASELIRLTHPKIAIWFEPSNRPMVLAWGHRQGPARRYARIAQLPLRRVSATASPGLVGTAVFAVGVPPQDQAGRIDYGNDVFRLDAGWRSAND